MNNRNCHGYTAAVYAKIRGCEQAIETLAKAGAKLIVINHITNRHLEKSVCVDRFGRFGGTKRY